MSHNDSRKRTLNSSTFYPSSNLEEAERQEALRNLERVAQFLRNGVAAGQTLVIDGPIIPEEFGDAIVEIDLPQLGKIKVPWHSFLVTVKLYGGLIHLRDLNAA